MSAALGKAGCRLCLLMMAELGVPQEGPARTNQPELSTKSIQFGCERNGRLSIH
jgi:hypothetical protein